MDKRVLQGQKSMGNARGRAHAGATVCRSSVVRFGQTRALVRTREGILFMSRAMDGASMPARLPNMRKGVKT